MELTPGKCAQDCNYDALFFIATLKLVPFKKNLKYKTG